MINYADNIARLRKWMLKNAVAAVVIPTDDPHMSEYPAAHFGTREYFTGFTGSAGTALIFPEEGYLWTDGRYYIQAEAEIAPQGLTLMRIGDPATPSLEDFLMKKLRPGDAIALDGAAYSIKSARKLREKVLQHDLKMLTGGEYIEAVWTEDRPPLPTAPANALDIRLAGKTTLEKLTQLREKMQEAGAQHYVLGSLDDIAWLMNLRGGDIPSFPVSYAYALIGLQTAALFIDESKPSDALRAQLKKDGVDIRPYAGLQAALEAIPSQDYVLVDPERVNYRVSELVHAPLLFRPELTALMKACKNDAELRCARKAHITDGACMVRLLFWVEQQLKAGEKLTEIAIENKTDALREFAPDSLGQSFTTISAFGEHGAMMHYHATEESNAAISRGLLVLDSGGQYPGATTDITRTLVFGEPTAQEKTDYTLTLKSHIAVATAKFLEGAGGAQLDALARQVMWQRGLDYKCGTGHGIGAGLSVHEGPQSLRMTNLVPLRPGMIVSNEPGVYRAGGHGIRIENLCIVREAEKTSDGQFYELETISWCPIEPSAIDTALLSDEEIAWLNSYHAQVYEKLAEQLEDAEKAFLQEKTRPISK